MECLDEVGNLLKAKNEQGLGKKDLSMKKILEKEYAMAVLYAVIILVSIGHCFLLTTH